MHTYNSIDMCFIVNENRPYDNLIKIYSLIRYEYFDIFFYFYQSILY